MSAADHHRYQSFTQQFLTWRACLVQFTGAGNIGIFDTVPGMRGLGYTMTFCFTLGMAIFVTECSYATVFLSSLMRSPLPWSDCSHARPSDSCYVPKRKMVLCSSVQEHILQRYRHSRDTQGMPVTDGTTTVLVPESVYNNFSVGDCINGTESSTRLFFDSRVLRFPADGSDLFHPEIAIAMAVLWLTVFAATRNGLQNAGYAVYVIASLTITTLTLMLVNSLALKHSDRGVDLLLRAPLSGVISYKLWRDALRMSISNIGIFSGGFLSTARFNMFKTNIGTFSVIVALMQLTSSLLYGLLFYAHVGFLSSVKGTDIERVLEGADIEHVIMPETLTILDTTRFWCTVYFTWLLSNALGYMMIGPDVVLEAVVFEFPGVARFRNEIRMAACISFYLLGLCLSSPPGPYIIKLLLPNVEIMATLSLLLEVLVIVHIYGLHRVMVDYHTMTGHYPNIITRLSWTFGVPFQLMVLLVFEVIEPLPDGYKGVKFGVFAKMFGIWIIVAAFSFIPTYLFALLTVEPWEKATEPAITRLPDDRVATREYRALLREFGCASKMGRTSTNVVDQPSLATSGQASVAAASRGDTVTVAETIDPREMVGNTERSVTFAPDVMTTPRCSENFNELLEQQFGLRSSRISSREVSTEHGLLDEASSSIQIKGPGFATNIDAVPATVFAKEDVEEIRKLIGAVDTVMGTYSPGDAGSCGHKGKSETKEENAESLLLKKMKDVRQKRQTRRGTMAVLAPVMSPVQAPELYEQCTIDADETEEGKQTSALQPLQLASPMQPFKCDENPATDLMKERRGRQSAVVPQLSSAALSHQQELDIKPTSMVSAESKVEGWQTLLPAPELITPVAQASERALKGSDDQAAHSGYDSQTLSEKQAKHSVTKERSGLKRKKRNRASPSRSTKKRASRQQSKLKKSIGKKRKSSESETTDATQNKHTAEEMTKGSPTGSPCKASSTRIFKGINEDGND
ncbi:hypothetical protein MRX96_026639 [Rhipicephalus microplus]